MLRNAIVIGLAFALASPLQGCPKQGSTDGTGCYRDVQGDLATIRKRLTKGKAGEAQLYVVGLGGCGEAQNSVEYHSLAALVAEELGDLNAAWAANRRGRDVAGLAEDEEAQAEFDSSLQRFASEFVWLPLMGRAEESPAVSYAGAVVDDATLRQLETIKNKTPVANLEGQTGYWVYPGRYRIGGDVVALSAGQSHALRPDKGASP